MSWAILVLSPDAIPPLAIGTSSVANAPEGTPIDFGGNASDPGPERTGHRKGPRARRGTDRRREEER